jgi:hypothetical protein
VSGSKIWIAYKSPVNGLVVPIGAKEEIVLFSTEVNEATERVKACQTKSEQRESGKIEIITC